MQKRRSVNEGRTVNDLEPQLSGSASMAYYYVVKPRLILWLFDWSLRLLLIGFILVVLPVIWDLLTGAPPWIVIYIGAAGWVMLLASLIILALASVIRLMRRLLRSRQ